LTDGNSPSAKPSISWNVFALPVAWYATHSVAREKQCQLELDNGAGATMRVQLVGYDASDVEAPSRSFWNALECYTS
jgi:hypothetical protein